MHIRKLDPSTFQPFYGVLCERIFPSAESGNTPFNAFWCIVEPGEASQLHRHHEGETFVIVKGSGVITVGEESSPVEVGDVVFMKPLVDHTLANTSASEQLLFLDIYWEDIELLLADDDGAETAKGIKTIACPAPPTPNGDLHLGHLSGPLLSSDMYIRHRRMMGDPAFLVIGTDDNQIWTAAQAKKRGETPQETADHFAAKIGDTMEKVGLDLGHFFRPNATSLNQEITEEIIQKLYDDGHLVAKDAPALCCGDCGLYLYESRVSGTCPHCGGGTCGNSCEECGLPNQVVDLIDPVCVTCGGKPVEKPVRRLFFPLEPHREKLEDYHRKTAMATPHRAVLARLMEGEMPDIVVGHPSDWGLPIRIEGFEGHVVSAWFEMLSGYLAGSAEMAEKAGIGSDWKTFWSAEDARVVQFFGFDNNWNHGVLYPAMLMAFDAEANPPQAFVTNLMYRLDGEKFSTSRNHAVWAREIVGLNSPDTVRCYGAHTCPEAEPTNYVLSEFADFVNDELIGRWQGWLADLQGRMDTTYEGKTPEAGAWTDGHLAFLKRLKSFLDEAEESLAAETFSPQRLTRVLCELVRSAHDFGKAESSWSAAPSAHNEQRTAFALELAAARTLAMMTQPLMPDFSNHLWACLGYEKALEVWETEPHFVTPGQQVSGLEAPYFPAPVIEKPESVDA